MWMSRPRPVWIYVQGHGWIAGAADLGGIYFEEEPPAMPQGSRIVAVERIEGEDPPDQNDTLLILSEVAFLESGAPDGRMN